MRVHMRKPGAGMIITRVVVLLIISFVVGTVATFSLFVLVALVARDGGFHGRSTIVMAAQPIVWAGVFWALYRSRFLAIPDETDAK